MTKNLNIQTKNLNVSKVENLNNQNKQKNAKFEMFLCVHRLEDISLIRIDSCRA